MITQDIPELALEQVAGGLSWSDLTSPVRNAYRCGVKSVTAVGGGWQLANTMYGTKDHGASWSDKWRAMKAFKTYLDGSDKLPSWAPNW
jgi:hypothetical protein